MSRPRRDGEHAGVAPERSLDVGIGIGQVLQDVLRRVERNRVGHRVRARAVGREHPAARGVRRRRAKRDCS